MTAKVLSIEALAKRRPIRGGKSIVFENLWLAAPRGEITCIIGPPGCGKSTLVNILAGIEPSSGGVVILDGHEIQGSSHDRPLMSAEPCLLPWRTVLGNVGYAVRAKWPYWPLARAMTHVQRFLELAGVAVAAAKFPAELSAGLQQRVALARALAVEPKLLLLDEAFIALDAITRAAVQDDLRRLCHELGLTIFLVTHDISEAILMADRIVLMSGGPRAVLAELLENPLPRERKAADMHRHPHYYGLRSHIADFLLDGFSEVRRRAHNPREVPMVRPSVPEPAVAVSSVRQSARSAAIATIEATTRSVHEARQMPSLRSLLRKARAEFGE